METTRRGRGQTASGWQPDEGPNRRTGDRGWGGPARSRPVHSGALLRTMGPKTNRGWGRAGEGGAKPEVAGGRTRDRKGGRETGDQGTSDRRLEILVRLRKYGRPRIRQRVIRGATFLVSLDSTVEAIHLRPTTSPFPSHPSSTFSPMSPVALMFPSPQPQFIRPTPQRTRTPSSNATR